MLKPMLAVEAKTISFPVIASYKIDGVRCLMSNGPKTRALKDLPNTYVRNLLASDKWIEGLDGELVVGSPTDPNVMQKTTSGLMSQGGKPDFTYYVFDYWTSPTTPFKFRYDNLVSTFADTTRTERPHIKLLEHVLINNSEELDAFEKQALDLGYEGIMIRDPMGPYKYGRSTAKEGYLLKVKRFTDSEARITGFVERMHNANELTTDNLGYAKRSSHKANMVPMGTLGALQVVDVHSGVAFEIGTGFDDKLRQNIWNNRFALANKIVCYKSFGGGVVEKPRFPVFKSFRDQRDM